MDSEIVKKFNILPRNKHINRYRTNNVINEIKEFLPKIAKANDDLKFKNIEDINIEIKDVNNDGPMIHMNLALIPVEDVDCEGDYISASSSQTSSDEDDNLCNGQSILPKRKIAKPYIEEIILDNDKNMDSNKSAQLPSI